MHYHLKNSVSFCMSVYLRDFLWHYDSMRQKPELSKPVANVCLCVFLWDCGCVCSVHFSETDLMFFDYSLNLEGSEPD